MEKQGQKFYYGWWIVLTGFLIMALVYSTLASVQALYVKPVTEDLGFSRTGFSVVVTIASFGLIIGSSFMGKVITRFSIKKVMFISCAIVGVTILGYSVCQELWQFYILAGIMGIAFTGVTVIPISVLINNWFGSKKKGLAMSLAFAGSGVGGMLLTMLLNNIVQSYGWRTAYMVEAGIILIVICPMISFIIKSTPQEKGLTRLGETAEEKSSGKVKSGTSMSDAKKTLVFWMIFLSFLLINLLNSGLLGHQIAYLSDIGFSEVKAANIGAIAVGSLALGKIILGSLCDKLGLKKGVLIGNTMFTLGLVALLMTTQIKSLAYVYIIMFCVGGAIPTIALPLFVGKVFGEKDYSALIGFMNVSVGVGAALGSIVCGKIYDTTGTYNLAWISFAVLSIVVIFLHTFSLVKKVKVSEKQINSEAYTN